MSISSSYYSIGIVTTYRDLFDTLSPKTERELFCLLTNGSITHVYTLSVEEESVGLPYFDSFLWNECGEPRNVDNQDDRLKILHEFIKSITDHEQIEIPIFIRLIFNNIPSSGDTFGCTSLFIPEIEGSSTTWLKLVKIADDILGLKNYSIGHGILSSEGFRYTYDND